MRQEIKDEALEQLKKEILFGFAHEDELLEGISEMFYDEDDFDEEWLELEIEKALKKHHQESLSWEKPTDFDKLVKAFDELNKAGIVALHKAGYTRQEGESDCLEIIQDLENIGVPVKGYCFYHTQDLERAVGEEKNLFIAFNSYPPKDDLTQKVANKIVHTLKKNGFKVQWNGSLDVRIEIVDIHWKKTLDDVDYNYQRVMRIIKNQDLINNAEKKNPFWKFW